MISEKPWRADAVLLLGAGLLIVLSMSVFTAALMKGKDAPPDFIGFVVSTVVTQAFAIGLIHIFLKAHRMSWRDLLGLRHPRLLSIAVFALALAVVASPITWAISSLVIKVITLLHQTPEQQIAVQVLETTKEPAQRAVFALAAIVMAEDFTRRRGAHAGRRRAARPRPRGYTPAIGRPPLRDHVTA